MKSTGDTNGYKQNRNPNNGARIRENFLLSPSLQPAISTSLCLTIRAYTAFAVGIKTYELEGLDYYMVIADNPLFLFRVGELRASTGSYAL